LPLKTFFLQVVVLLRPQLLNTLLLLAVVAALATVEQEQVAVALVGIEPILDLQ
jgi:hypothetical protein